MWADLLMGESKVTAHKETWVCMGGGCSGMGWCECVCGGVGVGR